MTKIRTLLTGTALAALLAAPVAALEVGGAGDIGLSLDTSVSGSAALIEGRDGARANAGTEADSSLMTQDERPQAGGLNEAQVQVDPNDGSDRGDSMAATDTVDLAAPPMVDSGFSGDVVYSADSAVLGMIASAGDNGDGTQKLVMAIDAGVESGTAQEISFTVDGAAESDGEIRLALTKAEFEAQLDELTTRAGDDAS